MVSKDVLGGGGVEGEGRGMRTHWSLRGVIRRMEMMTAGRGKEQEGKGSPGVPWKPGRARGGSAALYPEGKEGGVGQGKLKILGPPDYWGYLV